MVMRKGSFHVLFHPCFFLWSVVSERQARASSGDSAAEPEAAGLSQQGGTAPPPEIHGGRSQTAGGQAAQRGECQCASYT